MLDPRRNQFPILRIANSYTSRRDKFPSLLFCRCTFFSLRSFEKRERARERKREGTTRRLISVERRNTRHREVRFELLNFKNEDIVDGSRDVEYIPVESIELYSIEVRFRALTRDLRRTSRGCRWRRSIRETDARTCLCRKSRN